MLRFCNDMLLYFYSYFYVSKCINNIIYTKVIKKSVISAKNLQYLLVKVKPREAILFITKTSCANILIPTFFV